MGNRPLQQQPTQPSPAVVSHSSSSNSSSSSNDIYYAIKLEPEQTIAIHGILMPKRTLTWRDVLESPGITMRLCVRAGIPIDRLHRLQPDIREWIRHEKVTVEECAFMKPWRPDPFTDLGCQSIGDLVVYRDSITPQMLIDAGITFDALHRHRGLTPELMVMLKYSVDDWVRLGLTSEFLEHILATDTNNSKHWSRLFGVLTRADVERLIARASRQGPSS